MLTDKEREKLEEKHREKYGKIVNKIGLDYLIGLMPVKDVKVMQEKLRKDRHLNNIPLEEWDKAGIPLHVNAKYYGIYNAPYAYVCVLKEAARQWIERENKE